MGERFGRTDVLVGEEDFAAQSAHQPNDKFWNAHPCWAVERFGDGAGESQVADRIRGRTVERSFNLRINLSKLNHPHEIISRNPAHHNLAAPECRAAAKFRRDEELRQRAACAVQYHTNAKCHDAGRLCFQLFRFGFPFKAEILRKTIVHLQGRELIDLACGRDAIYPNGASIDEDVGCAFQAVEEPA